MLRSTDVQVFVSFRPSEICYLRFRCTRSVPTFWMRSKLRQLGLHTCRNKSNVRNNGGFGSTCWGSLLKLCVKIKLNRIPTRDARLHSLFYLETALHVSGGTTTHHQERKQLYLQHLVFVTPLLLPAAIVKELELLYCRYSCLRSWWWVVVPPETCTAVSR